MITLDYHFGRLHGALDLQASFTQASETTQACKGNDRAMWIEFGIAPSSTRVLLQSDSVRWFEW